MTDDRRQSAIGSWQLADISEVLGKEKPRKLHPCTCDLPTAICGLWSGTCELWTV